MSGLAASMIENGIAKGALFGKDKSMCLVGHAAFVFLSENGLYPTTEWEWNGEEEVEVTKFVSFQEWECNHDDTDRIWRSIPEHVRTAIHATINEEYPEWAAEAVWSFNDAEVITEDDILRVGKLVDERLNA